MNVVNLKPQDILVALKLMLMKCEGWTYPTLSVALGLSQGEVHNAVRRLAAARIYNEHTRMPRRAALEEFLIHGVKYAFPAERKSVARGVPTAWAAAPLKDVLAEINDVPPVWPHPDGTVNGYEFTPLYQNVAEVALRDLQMYELLALLDGIRGGGARERELAEGMLHERLKSIEPNPDST